MSIFAAPVSCVSSLHVLTKSIGTKNILLYILCIALSICC